MRGAGGGARSPAAEWPAPGTIQPEALECQEQRPVSRIRQESRGGFKLDPANLVHFIARTDRARDRSHGPISDQLATPGTGDVRCCGKFDTKLALKTGLLVDLASRASLTILPATQLSFRKCPILAMSSVDDQHLSQTVRAASNPPSRRQPESTSSSGSLLEHSHWPWQESRPRTHLQDRARPRFSLHAISAWPRMDRRRKALGVFAQTSWKRSRIEI